ncbi:kielin/chordin-like protein isoform X2 [Hyalella azteca]|uniref:Kielin/chordin-like protein isoform X2 n=1 Tax=Hyalella azteca TaxID=294128 RepID=A0A8B7N1W6_HYAAZ|nr:kielin/chordin-like protein isoform X2 [Hyalella azteca]
MRLLFAIFGLCALVLFAEATGPVESAGPRPATCTDGSSWFDGCNNCWCMGGATACSLKFCPDGTKKPPTCVDGSRWMMDNCNWCSCSSGTPVCTKRACLPAWAASSSSNSDRSLDASDTNAVRTDAAAGDAVSAAAGETDEPECEGTEGRWRVGCNWCRCNEKGFTVCTKRLCHPALLERLADTPVCEGNARWRDDCNWCSCTATGIAACTLKGCISMLPPRPAAVITSSSEDSPAADDDPTCEVTQPTDRWREDCNWCRCLHGRGACTKRGCPPGLRDRLSSTPECEGGARWKVDDCNWCSCSDGRAVCTTRACLAADLPATSEEGAKYEPDCVGTSTWTESCNNCHCANGVKACTLKGCLTEVEDTCQEGAVWKKDCNWCSCTNNRPVCSRRLCPTKPAGENEGLTEVACLEGSTWKDDCNTCTCTNGHAICTLRACIGPFRRPAVIPDPRQPQIEERSQTEDRPAVIPDPRRPQIEERPQTEYRPAVIPDPRRPQIEERPQNEDRPAVIPDPRRPQVQPRPSTGVDVPRDDRDCVPGSRFSVDGCNWCTCTERGLGVCTLMACFKRMDIVCEEGARWKQGCNWCSCVGGRAACTEMACFDDVLTSPLPGATVLEDGTLEGTPASVQCKSGSRWTHQCNKCECNDDQTSVCTNDPVCDPEKSEENDTCEEGAEWKQDCNVCQCGGDGRPVCTTRKCSGSEVTTLESYEECRPGSSFREACNFCRCSNKGLKLCTKMFCLPDYKIVGPQCSNGSVFLDANNCNWCHCVDDSITCAVGRSCARRRKAATTPTRAVPAIAAVTRGRTPVPAPSDEQCVDGTSWLQDCNRCRCIAGVVACDRRACLPSPRRDERPSSFAAAPDTSRCYKPADSGPCFASFRRFRFNAENNRCEAFLYGGCAGNDNNFESASECQRTCGGDAPVLDATCDRKRCPNHREVAYMAVRGCVPEYKDGSCCPTNFKCSEIPSSGEKGCVYEGKTYDLGADVPVRDPCSRCRCSRGISDAELICVSVECPSLFQAPDPFCRQLFRLDQCCSYDKECVSPVPGAMEPPPRTDGVTCSSEGRTYQEGDKMYFDTAPCQRCVCARNYTSPYGDNCTPVDCGYDTRSVKRIRSGCVPLYYKERCCPITYICLGDKRIASDQSQANPDGVTEDVCEFGGVIVARGRQLATTETKIKCTCQTPPSVTCVQDQN